MTVTDRASTPPSTGATPVVPVPPVLTPDRRRSGRTPASTLRRAFAAGAGLTALVLLVAIIAGSVSLARLTEARETLLDEIGPAVRANQSLEVALLNQETGIRGYALTRNAEFLAPYRDGLADEAAALARASRLPPRPAGGGAGRRGGAGGAGLAQRVRRAGDRAASGVGGPGPGDRQDAVRRDPRAAWPTCTAVLDARAAGRPGQAQQRRRRAALGRHRIAVVIAAFLAAAGVGPAPRRPRADRALADQVRGVVSGDVHREVRGSGPREIVELGADVDAMRVHISDEVDLLQEVNQRLDEQARDLERSNRDLEQFAYVASHDLQEPLRKVSSFCQLLQRRYGGQLDERADQYIGFAVDGAQRMQRLINDLLAFSRVGRTTPASRRSTCARSRLAAAAQVETTRAELDGEIVVGDLPRVQGDPALLRQLLLNLFGNGLKFHRPDVAPVVRVDARRDGEFWEFAVAGQRHRRRARVRREDLRHLPAAARPRGLPGTGIGLALVKKIVEFHGGRVWLDTGPRDEPGTVIRFTLPVESPSRRPRATGAAVTEPEVRVHQRAARGGRPGRRADDPRGVRRLPAQPPGRRHRRRGGAWPTCARSPRTRTRRGPDLILLDLNLPRRDGREVLQEIKDDPDLRHIPVIVLTTSQAEEDVLRSYQLHANAYVTKPVDFEGFIEAIKQIDHFFVSVVQLPDRAD